MKIYAVIVLFNDHNQESVNHVRKLSEQVDKVLLIDNSVQSFLSVYSDIEKTVYIPQYRNLGIASAQNIGIKIAIDEGADYILFADPDSHVPDHAVTALLSKHQLLTSKGYLVGSLGSTAYNVSTGRPYPLFSDFIQEIYEYQVTEVTYTTNSISLIKTEWFESVGLMAEQLFIDGVDNEWCWRGHAKCGLRFFLDDNVIIQHRLGIGNRRIFGKNRSIAAPYRLYYQYRNYLWLLRCTYVPKAWIKLNGKKYLLKSIYYPLFVKPRWQYLKNIIKGIVAGIKSPKNKLSL